MPAQGERAKLEATISSVNGAVIRKHLLWPCIGLLAAACLVAPAGDGGAAEPHWSYAGEYGPSDWDKADPAFFLCKTGKNQSPVNLVPEYATILPPLAFQYPHKGTSVVNNGHTVQVQFPRGNTLTAGDKSFELVQMHFHTPSEHHYNGKAYPLEGHLVHSDKDGNTAVLAVFFEEGENNASLAALWADMPQKAGERRNLHPAFEAFSLLPDNKEYMYFNGSLTTPPCSEGVRWYVLKRAVPVGREQIAAFLKCMGYPNNRPLQDVNARPVLQ
jgi:carbonic anhydrase